MADVSGPITSIGMMAGTITITPPGALPVTVVVSDNQRTKMLPRLHIGDVISVKTDESNHVKGGITITSQSPVNPVSVYPTKKEGAILAQGERENAILWQSCMKAAIEVEKFFAVGGAEDRAETTKNVIVITNNLYEASQRKLRGVPPIPETAPQ
jgi:hypothetical protein